MLKPEITETHLQTRQPYFPVRHWRGKANQSPEKSKTDGNEFKQSVTQIAKSLEIALRSFNKYGG